ncbi:MAG: DUF5330 domain-containing protein [Pseudomonadota bacterium]
MILFLVRTIFWIMLVVLLIPTDDTRIDPTVTQSISPTALLSVAEETVGDLSGLCDRRPLVCERGGEALTALVLKGQYLLGLLGNALDSKDEAQGLLDGDTTPLHGHGVAHERDSALDG